MQDKNNLQIADVITEAHTHLGFYAGWPKATQAIAAAARTLAK